MLLGLRHSLEDAGFFADIPEEDCNSSFDVCVRPKHQMDTQGSTQHMFTFVTRCLLLMVCFTKRR